MATDPHYVRSSLVICGYGWYGDCFAEALDEALGELVDLLEEVV